MTSTVHITDRANLIIASLAGRAEKAAGLIAEAIVADSAQENRIPKDNGDLERSGHTVKSEDGTDAVWDTPYAAYQYFTEELNHPGGGGPHWAQQTVDANNETYINHVRGIV